jgi:hypothetical protein
MRIGMRDGCLTGWINRKEFIGIPGCFRKVGEGREIEREGGASERRCRREGRHISGHERRVRIEL